MPVSKALPIVAVGVVTFTASIAIMLWNQRTDVVPPRESLTAPALNSRPAIPAAPPQAERSVQAEAAAQPSAGAEDRARPAPLAAVSAADSAPQMPLRLMFARPLKSQRLTGRIFNSTEEPMSLSVTIVEAGTQRTQATQVDVPANSQSSFGTDEDQVELHSGDRVTLQSAPYRDLIAVVP